MARLWTNSIRGELSSGVTETDTTWEADIFSELPVVSSPDVLRMTADPNRDEGLGKPEIVEVTDHAAGSTTVTVTRAVETGNNGGAAQAWPSGTTVVHALTSGDADEFVTETSANATYPQRITSDTTFQIPTDYADLQTAVDDLKNRVPDRGVVVTLNIESGHAPASGLSVSDGDYSMFKLTSTDATVTLDSSFDGRVFEGTNCLAPVFDLYVDGANATNPDRVYSLTNGIGDITSGSGGTNFTGRILYTLNGLLNAGGSEWRNFDGQIYCSRGSGWNLNLAVIEGGTVTTNGCLVISRGGVCDGQGMSMSDCAAGVEVKRGAAFTAHDGATFDNLSTFVVRCTSGSRTSIPDAQITNVVDAGLEASAGIIDANSASISAASGNSDTGVSASQGGDVTVTQGSVTGFGLDNLIARNTGTIAAVSTTVQNAGRHNTYATEGGRIVITDGESSGASSDDLRIDTSGSQIHANGCTTTNGSGSPDVGDTNVTSFNAIETNNGIIWN